MTDRELLEFAAKAAGYELIQFSEYSGFQILDNGDSRWWDPIAEDGDALRLAVKLKMFTFWGTGEDLCEAALDADPFSATRKTIVLRAAEIGKAMP